MNSDGEKMPPEEPDPRLTVWRAVCKEQQQRNPPLPIWPISVAWIVA